MKRRETIPTYSYGVRIDGLASSRQLIEMACCCAVALWLTIYTGSWPAMVVLGFAAIMLVRWCRAKIAAAALTGRRHLEADYARACLARTAGRGAAYRLTVGLQKPLELAR